jgi:dienelactone hydrolase
LKRLIVGLLCAGLAVQAVARRMEAVAFPSLDRGESGAHVALRGVLLFPRGEAPAGGFPAIVALHGCGGMYSTRAGHEDEIAQRMALRAEPLLSDGYAVLFVDSFRSRSVREVCTIRKGERTVTAARRRLDALGALVYLASRPDIARERIALIGWSHGASTALQAVNIGDRSVADFCRRSEAPPFFRAVVAFYPCCATPLAHAASYRPGAPTRIHIGDLDDWTSAASCVELGKAMASRSEDLLVTTYRNSHHGFDSPTGSLVHRMDVPNGVNPGQGVHVGPNEAAREAANANVRAFLRERLLD